MFRRSSSDAPADAATLVEDEAAEAQKAVPAAEAKKGRPTPKRSAATTNQRGRAYVPPDRKASARAAKTAGRSDRERQMLAMRGQGDPRDLPPRDAGPVRKFVRDYVDSRWTALEFAMPVVIVIFLLATLLRSASVVVFSTLALYAVILLIVVATFFFARGLRKELARRFPNQNTKGAVAYGLLRSSNIRKMRLPKPAVKRGQRP
ncbi:DUF3043 domain-containing protein [Streptacidiphilus pinicola]|uniref:DUF3043 domain-containing protein n=1 Tax=Streptacidiphilus pinicola TaxID=2219663 RepID=UPI00140400F2|nr:DUF3043 domain-containing protein [Streptacidiphilus pinicola]